MVTRSRSGNSTNGDNHVSEQSNPHRLPRQQRRSRTNSQRSFTTLSLATKSSYKKDGKYISHTEWHRCVVFGKLSEFAKTLTKGAHIQVEGELRSREYDSKKTDSKRRVWEVRVASILKLDRAEKAARKIRNTMTINPRRKRPHRPFLFTLGSPANRWASIAVRFPL
jgi:single-strand DNA-binding protein